MEIYFNFTPDEQKLIDFLKTQYAHVYAVSDVNIPKELQRYLGNFMKVGLITEQGASGCGNLPLGHEYLLTDLGNMLAHSSTVTIISKESPASTEMEDAEVRIDRGEEGWG